MNGKNIRRLIAAIMTLVCFFAYVVYEPAASLAETIGSQAEMSENIDEMNAIWDEGEKGSELGYSPIVGELIDLRNEDVKQLRRADVTKIMHSRALLLNIIRLLLRLCQLFCMICSPKGRLHAKNEKKESALRREPLYFKKGEGICLKGYLRSCLRSC